MNYKNLYLILCVVSGALYGMRPVNILTLNVGLLKVGSVTIRGKELIGFEVGDMRGTNKRRAELLGQALQKNASKYDVICFQEAFDYTTFNHLFKYIKDIYPYTNFDGRRGGWVFGVNSGLAMVSKYPIIDKGQEDFTCFKGEEAFARKGIMGSLINIDGCKFYVFTTHLQAGGGSLVRPIEKITRKNCGADGELLRIIKELWGHVTFDETNTQHIAMHELQQVRRFIVKFIEKNPTLPCILTGDFNINSTNTSKEYDGIHKIFGGIKDLHVTQVKTGGTAWWNPHDHDGQTRSPYRLDYVFLLNEEQSGAQGQSEVVEDFTRDMTDHLGVVGHIDVPCSKTIHQDDFEVLP